jgi:hypothetical protein
MGSPTLQTLQDSMGSAQSLELHLQLTGAEAWFASSGVGQLRAGGQQRVAAAAQVRLDHRQARPGVPHQPGAGGGPRARRGQQDNAPRAEQRAPSHTACALRWGGVKVIGKQRQLRAPSPDQTMSRGVQMLN